MTRCLNCMEEMPENARFCPHCGFARPRRPPRKQPPLPFSPLGPPRVAMQPSGAGAISQSAPMVGPPLSITTVLVAIAAVLLCLLIVIFVGRGGRQFDAKTPAAPANVEAAKALPLVGMMGEPLHVGSTTWGVAFTDKVETIDNNPAQSGQFFTVGVVIGNRGQGDLELSASSIGLLEEKSGMRYSPVRTAWGTPDDIRSGQYSSNFTLPPKKAIAGIIVFDVPKELPVPRLLIRDLTESSTDFTGEIDLTQERPQQVR